MMTGDQYRDSLSDGRIVYFNGQLIDVSKHPIFQGAVGWVARGYDRFYSSDSSAVNPLMDGPRTMEDLRTTAGLLSAVDHTTSVSHISLMTLLTAAPKIGEPYASRILAFYDHCRTNDLRVAECITDAKGDRTVSPMDQDDLDSYVRVVEQRPDGVVIRGAKLHITAAPMVHELLVMPTKRMKPGEEQFAITCAIPVNAPGVSQIAVTYASRDEDDRHFPYTRRENMPDGFIIFDDVFVPTERIFLNGEVEQSATFAHTLGLWERLGGITHMADEGDRLVGFAQLIAEANGLQKVAHIKEKIAELIIYATLIRSGIEAAIAHSHVTADGYRYPDDLYTNAAKYHAASNYNLMIRHIHDISGGSVFTAPTVADFENPDLRPFIEKYMKGATGTGEYRMRLFHAIRDITADMYGGWHLVANLQSGGGLMAQRLATRRHYNMERAKQKALEAADLP